MCHTMITRTSQTLFCFVVVLEIVDPTNILQDHSIGTGDLPMIH